MSAAVLNAHRAGLVALLAAVPDVGIMHERERYAKDEAAFRALYLYQPAPGDPYAGGEPHIRGWWLRRVASEAVSTTVASVLDTHTWELRGFMAFNDAAGSELVFDRLIEDMRDAVLVDPSLGGVADPGPLGEDEGMRVIEAGPVRFAGGLCHTAVLQTKTWSYS